MSWEAITGVLAVGVSLIIGVLTYLRSRKVDAVTETSGVASNNRAGTAQVIEGLQALVDNLQEDNKSVREEIRLGVAEAEARCERRIAEAVADLKQELIKRPTRDELLGAIGKLRTQLLDLGQTPRNGMP